MIQEKMFPYLRICLPTNRNRHAIRLKRGNKFDHCGRPIDKYLAHGGASLTYRRNSYKCLL